MGIAIIPAPSAGVTPKTFIYRTAGLTTFTLPSGYGAGNPLAAEVTILGGGGSAGKGYYVDSANFGVGGGGGAGGILKTELSLTSNMSVYVGNGGTCYGTNHFNGGNGEFSYIGNGTPKNLFINPQFIGYSTQSSFNSVSFPFTPGSGNNSKASAVRGSTQEISNYGTLTTWNNQQYAVKPSTQYTFSMYQQSNNSQYRFNLLWFTSNGTSISTTTGSTITGTNNTWVRSHVSTTSPSTAAFCTLQFEKVSGTQTPYLSNAQFEEGVLTPSTYVDGDSSGYRWGGVKTGSVTLLDSDTMFIANGGGGGAGTSDLLDNQTVSFSGACSGGWAGRTTSATQYIMAGSGGGLGGSAELQFVTQAVSGTAASPSPKINNSNRFADFHFGSSSSIGIRNAEFNNYRGRPGPANGDGYGRGGFGGRSDADSGALFSELIINDTNDAAFITRTRKLADGKPNSGDGGSSLNVTGQSVSTASIAGNGGSGLVIIKYWS